MSDQKPQLSLKQQAVEDRIFPLLYKAAELAGVFEIPLLAFLECPGPVANESPVAAINANPTLFRHPATRRFLGEFYAGSSKMEEGAEDITPRERSMVELMIGLALMWLQGDEQQKHVAITMVVVLGQLFPSVRPDFLKRIGMAVTAVAGTDAWTGMMTAAVKLQEDSKVAGTDEGYVAIPPPPPLAPSKPGGN